MPLGDGRAPFRVLQVDPSLFTAPYDAALSRGLRANGLDVSWATRPLRNGEEDLLGDFEQHRFFYPFTDGPRRRSGSLWRAVKGLEHAVGLRKVVGAARGGQAEVVHFQWGLVPRFDGRAIEAIRQHCPVVLTVHDTEPLNGARGGLQTAGFDHMLASVDRLIVHRPEAKQALIGRGMARDHIEVIAHGPLPVGEAAAEPRDRTRWRIVLFGRLQHYKGVDLAVEAMGRIRPQQRERIELVIAGEPFIDINPIRARIAELEPGSVDLRPRRLAEEEMAALLRSADAFLFPYRMIEASGVLYQIEQLGRWIVASDVGCFHDALSGRPDDGELVPPGDVDRLAEAMARSVGRAPAGQSSGTNWQEIGAMTRELYERLCRERCREVARVYPPRSS